MAETCKNCTQIINENFCANCGQKKFKRINRKYIFDELQYTFLHANKGLFYTLKNLIRNPGKTAREYIEGNRVNHYKPLLLAFVIAGIATFLAYSVLHTKEIMLAFYAENKLMSPLMIDVMSLVSKYNTIVLILMIPFFALTTKIAFRKWGNNYYEHIIMNSYILTLYNIVSIVLVYPILYYFQSESPEIFMKISSSILFLLVLILIWFFKTFYFEKSLKSVLLRVLAVLGLIIVTYVISVFAFAIVTLVYTLVMYGPEGLQNYVKPK